MRVAPLLIQNATEPHRLAEVESDPAKFATFGAQAFRQLSAAARAKLELTWQLIAHENKSVFYAMCSQLTGTKLGSAVDETKIAELVFTAMGVRGPSGLIDDMEALRARMANTARSTFREGIEFHPPVVRASLLDLLDAYIANASSKVGATRPSRGAAVPKLPPRSSGPAGTSRRDQGDIECDPAAFEALGKYYGVEAPEVRVLSDITLRPRDNVPDVSTAAQALAGVKGEPQLVMSVGELLMPGALDALKAKGFTGDTELLNLLTSAGAPGAAAARTSSTRVELKLVAEDLEGWERVRGSTGRGAVSARSARLKKQGAPAARFERTLQRVSIDFEAGKPVAAFLCTYSWPPAGLPGMNTESIYHMPGDPDPKITRFFVNEPLGSTSALSFSDGLYFSVRMDNYVLARTASTQP